MQFRSGFTLVELMVVIVVIAILATIGTLTFFGIQDKARTSVAITTANQWADEIDLRLMKEAPVRTGGLVQSCLGPSAAVFAASDGFAQGSCIDFSNSNAPALDPLFDSLATWYSEGFYQSNNWWVSKVDMPSHQIPTAKVQFESGMVVRMRGIIGAIYPTGPSNSGEPFVRIYWINSAEGASCGKGKKDTTWLPLTNIVGLDTPTTSGDVCQLTFTY